MYTQIVGLAGYKRSGKNTVAEMIEASLEATYATLAFADPLREMALAIDPVVGWEDPAESRRPGPIYYSEAITEHGYEAAKEMYPEFRAFLQRLGTNGVRGVLGEGYGLSTLIGGNVWVSLARTRINKCRSSGTDRIIFTDVRFPDEADMIREEGGRVVRIWRGQNEGDAHASEIALDDYDFDLTIDNTGTKSELAVALAAAGLLD